MAIIDAQHQRARAATVMQAGGGSASGAIAYLRGNPIAAVGALAVLFGFGYGAYVYLQISNPGMFVRQAATRPQESPAPAATTPPATPAPAPTPPAAPGLADVSAAANPAVPIPGAPPASGGLPPGSSAMPSAAPQPATSSPGPIAASSIIAGPRIVETPRDAAPERSAETPRERGTIRSPGETVRPASAAAASSPAEAQSRERIAVTPAAAQPRMNPSLAQGYTALQAGNLEEARSQYSRALQAEPQNIDAMLGLAYIAAQDNRTDEAVRFYTRILALNPRHAAAQAALIGVMGRADPVASESRLKQLLAREPSAFLHFVLGNLYSDQSLWAPAQQAYFQAHHLEPDNADYAYNLAVGLDHLGQRKLALNYYRRAEQLAASSQRANFSLPHARERIGALSSQLD
jgi:Flp pilus assembly protein TadD